MTSAITPSDSAGLRFIGDLFGATASARPGSDALPKALRRQIGFCVAESSVQPRTGLALRASGNAARILCGCGDVRAPERRNRQRSGLSAVSWNVHHLFSRESDRPASPGIAEATLNDLLTPYSSPSATERSLRPQSSGGGCGDARRLRSASTTINERRNELHPPRCGLDDLAVAQSTARTSDGTWVASSVTDRRPQRAVGPPVHQQRRRRTVVHIPPVSTPLAFVSKRDGQSMIGNLVLRRLTATCRSAANAASRSHGGQLSVKLRDRTCQRRVGQRRSTDTSSGYVPLVACGQVI